MSYMGQRVRMSLKLLGTVNVTSTVTSLTINVPSGSGDLVIWYSLRGNTSTRCMIRFNGSTSEPFKIYAFQQNESMLVDHQYWQNTIGIYGFSTNYSSNNYSTGTIEVARYADTSWYKNISGEQSWTTESPTGYSGVDMIGGTWQSYNAINSVNFVATGTDSLYPGSYVSVYARGS